MSNDVELKFHALQVAYAKKLPIKLAEIAKQWELLNADFDKQRFIDFHRAVHTLCGSAGTYGYSQLSQVARDLEIYLKQLLDYNALNAAQKSEIAHLLEKLQHAFTAKEDTLIPSLEPSLKFIESKLIYLIDHQEHFQQELKENLEQLGYKLITFKTCAEFQAVSGEQLPAAIIIDSRHLDDQQAEYLATFRHQYKMPILCIASQSDFLTRLKAIRAGASIFLHKPIEVSYLTKLLDDLCGTSIKENYRILILDDSDFLAKYYAFILREAKMEAHFITDPKNLLQELNDFNPDLLLMDLYMPDCTGVELATIIRQEERYASLPIIFISTEEDRFKQLATLSSAGGDDFLTKPILPQHLVSAVKARAKRSALLLSYITHDSLTNLLNHTYILQQLELEILRAKRQQQMLAFAMLDLDNFKQANDKYGHPIGDVILRKAADFISTRLRKTDFIGRYGGEEFAIIFPATSLENAIKICEELCEKFSLYPFESSEDKFYVTFSVGVAAYPTFATVDSLVAAADRALYRAKSEGRNRVIYLSHSSV